MEFRVGVNLGDVVEDGERIYGDGVNIAARVESLAEGGGICISGTAFDQIGKKLPLGYEYLGEQTVKNIEKPVRVYRVLTEPEAAGKVIGEKRSWLKRWQWAALAVVAVSVVGVLIWIRLSAPPVEVASVGRMAFPLPDKPSIAVLPFENLSRDLAQEYFADGMTDDLITDLSKISGLFVIARNSVFTYKGKSVKIRQVGEELGVRYVLEGSVRKADKRVRINAQLVDATTGGHLWAERYDSHMSDVFALQDKITKKIVAALAVKLTAAEHKHVACKDTDNIAAYDAFLQGWGHYLRRTPDDFAKAVRYFEKAIELDPNYGRAYAALGLTYWKATDFDWHRWLAVHWTEGRLRARQYLEMAMKTPTSHAHRLAADMAISRHQLKGAIAEAEQAIAFDPNNPDSHLMMATALIFAGRPQEAVDFLKRAMLLDPHNPGLALGHLGLAHFCMGQLEEAVTLIERAFIHNPELHPLSAPLAAAYAHLGRDKEARDALFNYSKTWMILPNLQRVMYHWPFKDSEVADRFVRGLLKAGLPVVLPGVPGSGYYKVSEEHNLTAEEIRDLTFGRTITGFSPWSGRQWWVDRTKDGEATYRGARIYRDPSSLISDNGTSWIEGDMLCSRFQKIYEGLTYCENVFRNPESTPEMKNEYLSITDFGIIPWSPVD